jgi:uncharacterized protein (TIGR03437 family)
VTQFTPAIEPAGIADAASFSHSVASGALASLFGSGLSEAVYTGADLFDRTANAFRTATPSGVSVTVDGTPAPLTYVSPGQINFQVPWKTATSPATLPVLVRRGTTASSAEPMTYLEGAPSFFADSATGVAILQCGAGSDATSRAGAACVLWANGLGPKNTALSDGTPAPIIPALSTLEVQGGSKNCQLSVQGKPAQILYCGAAPGLVIDQLNFVYPDLTASTGPVSGMVSVRGFSSNFLLPGPR